jgi:hypothetical protein
MLSRIRGLKAVLQGLLRVEISLSDCDRFFTDNLILPVDAINNHKIYIYTMFKKILAISLICATFATPAMAVVGTQGEILNVSQSKNIASGEKLVVTGKHYDETIGIYVAMCVVVPSGQLPTPCGGGADMTGSTGASSWISSNPPTYGVGLAKPYLPGGRFRVVLKVSPIIHDMNKIIDCRKVACAIYTRADHTRGDDRSVDLYVPLQFKK